jgi:hypothetical protein
MTTAPAIQKSSGDIKEEIMGVTEGAGPRRWPLLELGRAMGPIGSTSPGLSDKKSGPGQQ